MPFVRGPVKGEEKKKTTLKTIVYSPFLRSLPVAFLCPAAKSWDVLAEAAALYMAGRGDVFKRASLLAQLSSPRSRNFCPQVICSPCRTSKPRSHTHQKKKKAVQKFLLGSSRRTLPSRLASPNFPGFSLKSWLLSGAGGSCEAPDVEQHWACSESLECHLDSQAEAGLSARFHQASALVLQSAFPELCFPNVCRPQGGCETPEQAGWRLVELL